MDRTEHVESTPVAGADPDPVGRYLARIGLDGAPPMTLEGLETLMTAHLTTVPFENLDVYWQRGVSVDLQRSVTKIVDHGRGGWCFELNGAFAWLLRSLAFEVRLLGAAVLLGGPNRMVDHLVLEVVVEGAPHLVDVGFGDGFAAPLPLNRGPDERLDGGTDPFGLMPSAEGTTLVRYRDEVPEPQYRFRRVSLAARDLAAPSDRLYHDPDCAFRQGPVATRLLGTGSDRVTLTTDRFRLVRDGATLDEALEPMSQAWDDHLREWFGIDPVPLRPGASGSE